MRHQILELKIHFQATHKTKRKIRNVNYNSHENSEYEAYLLLSVIFECLKCHFYSKYIQLMI